MKIILTFLASMTRHSNFILAAFLIVVADFAATKAAADVTIGITVDQNPHVYYGDIYSGWAHVAGCGTDTVYVTFEGYDCTSTNAPDITSPIPMPPTNICQTTITTNADNGTICWELSAFTGIATNIVFTANYTPPGELTEYATNTLYIDGGSCSTSNCDTCTSIGCSQASVSKCLDFRIGLGPGTILNNAGYIMLRADTPSTSLGTPALLQLPVSPPSVVTVTTNSGGISQVLAPFGLTIVTNVGASQYQLQVFSNGTFTAVGGGLYSPGTNAPYMTYVITNLYNSANSDVLTITQEQSGLSNRVFQYTYTNGGTNLLRWDLLEPDGATTLSKWYTTVTNDITNSTWQTTEGNTTLGQTIATIQYIPTVGFYVTNELVQGAGSVTQTTTNTFYATNAAVGSSNRLQLAIFPNGNWCYYQYDSLGRITNMFSAFGNSAPPAAGVVPDVVSNQCKETTYDFTPIAGTTDDGTYQPFSPRTITVILPASGATNGRAEVSRTYHEVDQFHTEDQLCASPGAAYGAPGNVRTVTYFYPDATGGLSTTAEQGQIKSVSLPDGSAVFYNYEYVVGGSGETNLETDQYIGAPDDWEQPGTIENGTETSTTVDQFGRMLSRTVTDPSVYPGILAESTWTYSSSDPLGRDVTIADNLSGLSTSYEYACCGLESITDPEGVVTSYGYDVMKRPITISTIRGTNAITTTTTYDGLGRVLEIQRTGTDNNTITQGQFGYDVSSREIAATNALGGTNASSYTVVGDQQIISNSFSYGGTSIELDYRDGTLQKLSGTAVQPMRYTNLVLLDGGYYRRVLQQIQLDGSGNDTSNWTEAVIDGAGRQYKTIHASSGTNHPFAISYFSADTNDTETAGLITNQVSPDGVSEFYVYNAKGQLAFAVLDVNQNSNIDWSGPDRITFFTNYVTNRGSVTVNRKDSYVWGSSVAASNLFATVEYSADGLSQWYTLWTNGVAVTGSSHTAYSGSNRYVTNTAPNGAYVVNAYLYGELVSIAQYDSNGVQIGQVTNGYDAQERLNSMTDARMGTFTGYFNNADQLTSIVTPAPGVGQNPEVWTNFLNNLGQVTGYGLPDNTYVTNLLDPSGLISQTYGSREYPVGYGYDTQERITKMTNWTSFLTDDGSRVTTWNYDPYRGWLSSKVYDDGKGPIYTNTAAGRLQTRLWARGTNTAYSYNGAGDLATVIYNDGLTATVTNGYDRLGHKTVITNGAAVCNLTYNDSGLLLSESNSGGPLGGWSVTNGYDAFLRRTNMVVLSNSTPMWTNDFTYDAASRLATVSDTRNSAAYSYLANSPLVSQIAFKQSGTTRMTTTKQYDLLNRLTSIGTTNAGSATICSSAYGYNSANQRTSMTNADGSYWVYGYDSLGQVTSAVKYWSDGTPAPGEQFGNAFDDIGNRANSQMGGNANGFGLRNANYTANDLNQYTSRTVPGAVDILGSATNTATVTVNGILTYRHGSNYEATLPISNAGNAVWQLVTNEGVLGASTNTDATITGSLFLPQNPENFSYDPDGNLISDGRFTNVWDAENRLIGMTNIANIATAGKYALSIAYDYQGRRIQKIVYTNSGSAWIASYTNKFIYDGWNLVAILDGGNNLLDSFVWGNDLSGSQQGAGGVGGLISMNVYSGANTGTYFYCYDGNGNVMALVNASNGAIAGQYEYGPFGEVIRATGPMAFVNPFRFSTKYQDDETAMLYCGYRYYNPSIGRWLNRDPIGEAGGINLYGAMGNDLVNNVDPYGLWIWFGWFRSQPSQPAPYDPNSYKAMRDSMIGDPSDYDFNGKTAGQVTQDIGMAVPKGIAQAAMMIPFGPEEEAAAAAEEAADKAKCFKSFGALKRAMPNTPGNVWHHIVEQSQEGRFGTDAIQNADNVIEVTPGVNQSLNALYSSIRPDITGSDTQTVRQWLSTQTLNQAQSFGMRAVINVSNGTWP